MGWRAAVAAAARQAARARAGGAFGVLRRSWRGGDSPAPRPLGTNLGTKSLEKSQNLLIRKIFAPLTSVLPGRSCSGHPRDGDTVRRLEAIRRPRGPRRGCCWGACRRGRGRRRLVLGAYTDEERRAIMRRLIDHRRSGDAALQRLQGVLGEALHADAAAAVREYRRSVNARLAAGNASSAALKATEQLIEKGVAATASALSLPEPVSVPSLLGGHGGARARFRSPGARSARARSGGQQFGWGGSHPKGGLRSVPARLTQWRSPPSPLAAQCGSLTPLDVKALGLQMCENYINRGVSEEDVPDFKVGVIGRVSRVRQHHPRRRRGGPRRLRRAPAAPALRHRQSACEGGERRPLPAASQHPRGRRPRLQCHARLHAARPRGAGHGSCGRVGW